MCFINCLLPLLASLLMATALSAQAVFQYYIYSRKDLSSGENIIEGLLRANRDGSGYLVFTSGGRNALVSFLGGQRPSPEALSDLSSGIGVQLTGDMGSPTGSFGALPATRLPGTIARFADISGEVHAYALRGWLVNKTGLALDDVLQIGQGYSINSSARGQIYSLTPIDSPTADRLLSTEETCPLSCLSAFTESRNDEMTATIIDGIRCSEINSSYNIVLELIRGAESEGLVRLESIVQGRPTRYQVIGRKEQLQALVEECDNIRLGISK